MNITRGIDFEHKLNEAKRNYLDIPFGKHKLYLNTLATHPDYQSRGAGSKLVLEGLKIARSHHLNATLIATPVGEPLYHHLGFVSIANISITSVDKDEAFPYDVMYYNPDLKR